MDRPDRPDDIYIQFNPLETWVMLDYVAKHGKASTNLAEVLDRSMASVRNHWIRVERWTPRQLDRFWVKFWSNLEQNIASLERTNTKLYRALSPQFESLRKTLTQSQGDLAQINAFLQSVQR